MIIYIIKQNIRIYVPYSRPNGQTEQDNIFCGHSWVAMGCQRLVSYKVESCERIYNDDRNDKLDQSELNTLLDTAEKEDETQELCI